MAGKMMDKLLHVRKAETVYVIMPPEGIDSLVYLTDEQRSKLKAGKKVVYSHVTFIRYRLGATEILRCPYWSLDETIGRQCEIEYWKSTKDPSFLMMQRAFEENLRCGYGFTTRQLFEVVRRFRYQHNYPTIEAYLGWYFDHGLGGKELKNV